MGEEDTTLQDFIYYDTDFSDPSPQVSSFCSFLSSNLGLGNLWWLAGLIQLSALLPLLVLYRLCNLLPVLNFITISSIVTFYLNASLWIWSLYLILALANCGIGVENPTFITGIVLVSIFGFFSILDCLFGREGWYLVDLKPMKDASRYFEKIKTSPPVHRIHIECFHTNTTAALNTRGNIFTRSQKVVTYCDHRDFPLTSWSDLSDWPPLETIANQGVNIIGVNMERQVEPGDKETRDAFDTFKNKFVQQNCHRDVEIRTWVTSEIPDMGPEQSLFITTRTKEQTPFIFNIGFYLFLAVCCLSCPLKTYIMKKTKLIPLKVTKVYFYDPSKPSAVLVPSQAINGPAPDRVINSTQSVKSDYDKMNTMGSIGNDFPQSRSIENLNYQKVLLDAVTHRQNLAEKQSTKHKAKATYDTQDTNRNNQIANIDTHGTTPTISNQQFVLLSPAFGTGNKTFLLSPMQDPRIDTQTPSKLILVPVENIDVPKQGERGLSSALAVRTPVQTAATNTDRHTETELMNPDTESAAANSYSLYLQQNNLTSYQPPNSRYKQWNMMESSFHNKFNQDKNLPTSNFSSRDMYEKHTTTTSYNPSDSRPWTHQERGEPRDCMDTATSTLYLPGKDYYDESLYNQRHPNPPRQAEASHDQYYEEEERMYHGTHPHPRVAMLKNTNVEADMLARRQDSGSSRKVHYSSKDEEGGYLRPAYRRYQSPSPGPRQRHQNPGGHHRSRRAYSDERDQLTDSGRGIAGRGDKFDNSYYNNNCAADTERLIEEEMQYNA